MKIVVRNIQIFSLSLAAAFVIQMPKNAEAESTLTFVDYDKPDRKQIISIKGTYVRIDLVGGSADSYLLFDSRKSQVKMVRTDKAQYMVFSKEKLKQMSQPSNPVADERMKQARAMMQEKMKNMSPQQRAMAEQMMKRMGGSAPPARGAISSGPQKKRKAVATKRSKKIKGIHCKVYKLYTNGAEKGEACVAKANKLGLSKKEVSTLQKMFATMQQLRSASSAARFMPRENPMMAMLRQVDGIPIEFTQKDNIEPKGGLMSFSKKKKTNQYYKVPKSYSEFSFGDRGRHRH